MQEERLEDVNEEEGLHKVINDNGTSVRRLSKTAVETGLQSGTQREESDQNVEHLNERVIFTHNQIV